MIVKPVFVKHFFLV